jgi:hypothetical protein
MHYVKEFNINGITTRQAACIELRGVPNAATEGYVGVLGIDVTSPTHDVYKCVAVNGGIYTWELLSSGTGGSSSGGATTLLPDIMNDLKIKFEFNYYKNLQDAITDIHAGLPTHGTTNADASLSWGCATYEDYVAGRWVLVLLKNLTAPSKTVTFDVPIEINFAGNKLNFASCAHQWKFTKDAYLNGTLGGGVTANLTTDGASYPLNFEGTGSLVVDGGTYTMSGGANHATSSAVLLYTKQTMASVTIKNAIFDVEYGGTSKCYGVVCNAQKNHVENVSVTVIANGAVDDTPAKNLYGMQISSAGGAKSTVCNSSVTVQANEIGTHAYGIYLNNQSVATFTDNTIYTDAGDNSSGGGVAIAVTIQSACEKVFINGGSYTGTHSAINTNSPVVVDGGKFVSCSHGGIYFAHPNKTSYVKNAELGIEEYAGEFEMDEMTNQTPFAPFYIGGSSGYENIIVHMDNCTLLVTENTAWSGGVVRGTSGEKNSILYVSNTTIPEGKDGLRKLRIDNYNHVHVGTGTNITDDIIVAGSASVVQEKWDDAVTYAGNFTYTYENAYINEKVAELMALL